MKLYFDKILGTTTLVKLGRKKERKNLTGLKNKHEVCTKIQVVP